MHCMLHGGQLEAQNSTELWSQMHHFSPSSPCFRVSPLSSRDHRSQVDFGCISPGVRVKQATHWQAERFWGEGRGP